MHDSRAKHFFSYEALKDYKIDSVWRLIYKHKNIADNFSFKKIINKKITKRKAILNLLRNLKFSFQQNSKILGLFWKFPKHVKFFLKFRRKIQRNMHWNQNKKCKNK